MKKLFTMFVVTAMLGFMACNGNQESTDVQEGDAAVEQEMNADLETEATDEPAAEMLAEHVCNDACTPKGCSFKHGEKGHTCSDACHAGEEVEEMNGGEE